MISNALKFTSYGGSIVTTCKYIHNELDLENQMFVKYFKEAKHGMIEISVRDTGIGIKKKDQKKLFQIFGFLDSSKELNPKGIGLGLNISKKIAIQFGGDLKVYSEF